jgi:CBS domain containing-hemolysin-like protein
MDPDPYSTLDHIYLLILLIVINGAFVAGEYALISCDPSVIRDPENRKRRKSAVWLLDHSELSVASIQLGITVCSLIIGWIGIDYFQGKLASLFLASPESFVLFVLPLVLAVVLLTVIHVIFGELVVKAIATSFPEVTLIFPSRPY